MERIHLAIAGSLGMAALGGVAFLAGSPALVGWGLGGLAATGLLGTVVVGSLQPGLRVYGPAHVRGSAEGRRVALTFDDGPDPASTDALVDALEARGARATFFVLLDRCERHPALLDRIARGHEVALHGWTHDPWLPFAAPARSAAALREARDRLEARVGRGVRWYRPPFGATSPRLVRATREAGLETVWGSVRTGDGLAMAPEALRAACQRLGPGDIAILHEGPRAARTALPSILEDLAARDLRPVTVGELLGT